MGVYAPVTVIPLAWDTPDAFDADAWLDAFREVGGWWVTGSDGKPVTNARNLESPFWCSMLTAPNHRCMVPATDFQEFTAQPNADTRKKTANWFSVPSRPVFAFAGIWRKIGEVPQPAGR